MKHGANHVTGIKMIITAESSLLVRHLALVHRLAPPEWLGVLPHERLAGSRRLQIPPVFPWPGATTLFPVTVRLQCQYAVHHPGALPSLRPERQKKKRRASKSQAPQESVPKAIDDEGDGRFAAAASNGAWGPGGALRHEPAPNRRPRNTAGRSPAPPRGSCARSRSTGTPTAPRRPAAARSPPPCSPPPAGRARAQHHSNQPSRYSGKQRSGSESN